ncbi:MAG TPA: endonuclease/exonuclease/phosphatase family protein [Pyrinomonadaceae bacterium]|jgi:hypothetical protein
MTFLFWNIRKNPLQDLLAVLVREHSVDVLILAECEIDDVTLLETLNKNQSPKYGIALNYVPNKRIKIFTLLPRDSFQPLRDEGTAVFHLLHPPIGKEIILVSVHLSSKMFQSDRDQAFNVTTLAQAIREVEIQVGHSRTLVVGDLNMNPFEDGLVAAATLHAVMTKEIALRKSRIVSGEEKLFFYNPMWGQFGDYTPGVPGTYYYGSGNQVNYFWNIFDQVLLRPQLLTHFDEKNLQILSDVGKKSLLNKRGIPNTSFASDHLPILFQLSI